MDATSTNLRLMLKNVLQYVRFPIMTAEEVALHVVPKQVLTPEESTLLFQHMVVTAESR
jgi:hypothetical protein